MIGRKHVLLVGLFVLSISIFCFGLLNSLVIRSVLFLRYFLLNQCSYWSIRSTVSRIRHWACSAGAGPDFTLQNEITPWRIDFRFRSAHALVQRPQRRNLLRCFLICDCFPCPNWEKLFAFGILPPHAGSSASDRSKLFNLYSLILLPHPPAPPKQLGRLAWTRAWVVRWKFAGRRQNGQYLISFLSPVPVAPLQGLPSSHRVLLMRPKFVLARAKEKPRMTFGSGNSCQPSSSGFGFWESTAEIPWWVW